MNPIQVIVSDEEKTIYSVRVTIVRNDKVDSGSMMFNHPRYYTFGQTVIFTDKEISEDQGGALVFKRGTDAEVLKNILDYIPCEKIMPENSAVMESE